MSGDEGEDDADENSKPLESLWNKSIKLIFKF